VILLAADDPAFAQACSERLRRARHAVAVSTTEGAAAVIARLHPDVVVVDAGRGEGATAELLACLDSTRPTIMLLNHGSLDDVMAAVDALDSS
jgi:DNA-binding response OmpR family regulator